MRTVPSAIDVHSHYVPRGWPQLPGTEPACNAWHKRPDVIATSEHPPSHYVDRSPWTRWCWPGFRCPPWAVFLTHHHSDHNVDVGNLVLLAWASNLTERVRIVGPPPLLDMCRAFLEMSRFDVETRIADEGRPPLEPLIDPQEISSGGLVYEDENVRVTATHVVHPPIDNAFGFRFDTADRSIVIFGDTAVSQNL